MCIQRMYVCRDILACSDKISCKQLRSQLLPPVLEEQYLPSEVQGRQQGGSLEKVLKYKPQENLQNHFRLKKKLKHAMSSHL